MKNLFVGADQYMKESSWKDFAMLKLCVGAMGIMIGMAVPEKKKEPVFLAAGLLFMVTYIPLMGKFIKIMSKP